MRMDMESNSSAVRFHGFCKLKDQTLLYTDIADRTDTFPFFTKNSVLSV
jgi:hypothetical protein